MSETEVALPLRPIDFLIPHNRLLNRGIRCDVPEGDNNFNIGGCRERGKKKISKLMSPQAKLLKMRVCNVLPKKTMPLIRIKPVKESFSTLSINSNNCRVFFLYFFSFILTLFVLIFVVIYLIFSVGYNFSLLEVFVSLRIKLIRIKNCFCTQHMVYCLIKLSNLQQFENFKKIYT